MLLGILMAAGVPAILNEASCFRQVASKLRVYHPIENGAVGWVNGGGDAVDGSGAGIIEPI
jgi:hypothetical protein